MDKHVLAATEFIRKKVNTSYKNAPGAKDDALDVAGLSGQPKSRHQQYMFDLVNSGKTVAEIQTAWHEYYAGLTDADKHQVWNEFYAMQEKSSHFVLGVPVSENAKPTKTSHNLAPVNTTYADVRDKLAGSTNKRAKLKPTQHLQSLAFGLGLGSVVLVIFLFSFFNERFIAPFIQPSRAEASSQIINSTLAVGPNPEVIIPKINVEIPVVYGANTADEMATQRALEGGVVHYTGTALPGQNGNVAIVGHSSNNIFNKGKYKFAFVLLSRLEVGDTFYLQKDGKRYTYEVYEKKIVKPTEVGVLGPATGKTAVATLITCDPPGTSTNRLVVVGEQISPAVSTNSSVAPASPASEGATIPGNSPSLWSRLGDFF